MSHTGLSQRLSRNLRARWILLFTLVAVSTGFCTELRGVRLSVSSLSGWQEKSFKGHTAYTPVQSEGKTVLHAESAGNASGLYHDVTLHAADFPLISWSWKIQRTIPAENPYAKSGDDFAARVYVVFPGRFFWQTRALVYVWSDKLPVGSVIPSVFTANVAVIALESGNQHSGTWRHEARNYVEDFRAYFHAEPPDPSAVAIMTDTDNSGGVASAWYGDILFSRAESRL